MDIQAAVWSTAFINDLPDSCFAVIEPGGSKDSEGKTIPRSLRHLPYKDASGKVDLAHLRNALARLSQTSISSELKNKARRKLENAAKEAGVGQAAASTTDPAERLLANVTELQAVGRMISGKNMKMLMDAHEMLGKLIDMAKTMESSKVYFSSGQIRLGN